MASEARIRANKKYDEAHTKQYKIKLNLNSDSDIIEKLDSLDNKTGYIKSLIRKDLASSSAEGSDE